MRTLWRSATLRSAAVLGISGVGFAVANLVLVAVGWEVDGRNTPS